VAQGLCRGGGARNGDSGDTTIGKSNLKGEDRASHKADRVVDWTTVNRRARPIGVQTEIVCKRESGRQPGRNRNGVTNLQRGSN